MNEAELLFSAILNCDRISLYLNKDLHLEKEKSALISSALKRRIQGEPIQYILGKTEFMGLEFKVTPDVFIPRPETEILVETVIRKSANSQIRKLKVLDIGTGSGCIAIVLAKLLSDYDIMLIATDVSEPALKVAEDNARLNKVLERVKFIKSDLFPPYAVHRTPYDIIVSNPPYVSTSQIDTLQPEIRYEPRISLDGGKDGLVFHRRLITDSVDYLKEGGFLILEIGLGQMDAVENIFQKLGNFEIIEVVKDYNGIDRVIVAQNSKRKAQN